MQMGNIIMNQIVDILKKKLVQGKILIIKINIFLIKKLRLKY